MTTTRLFYVPVSMLLATLVGGCGPGACPSTEEVTVDTGVYTSEGYVTEITQTQVIIEYIRDGETYVATYNFDT